MYKYYNPNLIRNQGLIKKDQNIHCDFPTKVIIFSPSGKHNTNTITSTNKNKPSSKYQRHQGKVRYKCIR